IPPSPLWGEGGKRCASLKMQQLPSTCACPRAFAGTNGDAASTVASHPLDLGCLHRRVGFRDVAGGRLQLGQDVLNAVGDQQVDVEAGPDELQLFHVGE